MRLAHLRNPHDGGYDIATGRDISMGDVVGHIYWDDPGDGTGNAGLVIRWADDDEYGPFEMPDSAEEAVSLIEAHGYELDVDSRQDIAALKG
ncbi:hypothetical protein [Candidatus Solirubrobacter pratensis]|uniref:hypothetical protein n=1 Tax=Candidatus Solirubrobacter pratensis TaxID=1298857 RepID=UPI000420BE71|nr:hypothetical protein [Candidatus Solirubrobacter pratensis]